MRGVTTAFLAIASSILPAQQDPMIGGSLVMKDGRFIQAPKIKNTPDNYILVYTHGSVVVPKKLVSRAFILDDIGNYKPRNQAEEKKIKKGYILFEGKWISRARLEAIIKKRKAKRLAAIEELKKHSKWRNRYKSQTKHFRFEYNVAPEIARYYMGFFETYWNVFNKRWHIKQPKKLGRLRICIFSNYKEFLRITGMPSGVLGFFRFVEPLEINFFHDSKDIKFILSILLHECNHYFMYLYVRRGVQNPSWVEEGLAEYFGGSKWDPKKKVLIPGQIQEGRLITLRDAMDGNEYLPLEKMLKMYDFSAIHYAWAWSFCHMLFSKKKYAKGFATFIKKLAKDKTLKKEPYPRNPMFFWVKPKVQIALLKKCLKVKDLKALEKEWYDYIKSMKVGSPRGYYRAAQECQRWQRPIRANMYYKKALELDPTYVPVYEGYARFLISQGKFDEAKKIILKGQKYDPINPYLYLLLGKIAKEKESFEKAQKYCNLALEMAPDDVGLRWEVMLLLEDW